MPGGSVGAWGYDLVAKEPLVRMTTNRPTTDERVGQLRGAGVAPVDTRRLAVIVVSVCVAGLAVCALAFFFAAAHRNAQLEDLEAHGTAVTVTVTRCDGLLGGSGTNVAGYVCRGSFTIDDHHYNDLIPGTGFYPVKATVPAVVARDNPGLLYTDQEAATDRPSDRVYVLPAVLGLVALGLGVVALVGFTRRRGPVGHRGTTPGFERAQGPYSGLGVGFFFGAGGV